MGGDMDLATFLKESQPLSLKRLQDLWRQMLQTVQQVHSGEILHMDLKPGNFLFVQGRLKVIDFGISGRMRGDGDTTCKRKNATGTPNYMPPEAARLGPIELDSAADV